MRLIIEYSKRYNYEINPVPSDLRQRNQPVCNPAATPLPDIKGLRTMPSSRHHPPRRLLLAAACLMASLAAPAIHAQAPAPIKAVVTTSMLADTVQEIGGSRVAVTGLMGTGVDPHTYRQTRSDIVKLTGADIVFWHGLNLEAQLRQLLGDLGKRKPVVALAEAIPQDQLLADEDNPQQFDPHVWMEPRLWHYVIDAARDALIQLDPAGADAYRENAKRYAGQLDAVNARITQQLQAVPAGSRMLLTAHDAFRYFGRANSYEVMGIQGISTESEASLNQIEALVNTLIARDIRAIFVETSVSDQNIRALIEGAAARGHKVVIGGELFSDAMGKPGTPEGTYLGMIAHNAATIAGALRGAP